MSGLVHISKISTPALRAVALDRLDPNSSKVYIYLRGKIGTSRVPKRVPLLTIATYTGLSFARVRYAMDRLVHGGLIQKYSNKIGSTTGRPHTDTYYRLTEYQQ